MRARDIHIGETYVMLYWWHEFLGRVVEHRGSGEWVAEAVSVDEDDIPEVGARYIINSRNILRCCSEEEWREEQEKAFLKDTFESWDTPLKTQFAHWRTFTGVGA